MQLDSPLLALLGNWILLSATQKGQSGSGEGSNEQLLLQCYIWSGRGVGKLPETMGALLDPLFD